MATSTLGSGTLVLAGTTSGTTTVTATAVAGTTTLTLPAATDTLVGKATTDTLTNKTLTTPSVSSPTISDGTANGVAYLNGSKVLTTGSALVFDATNTALSVGGAALGTAANRTVFTLNATTSNFLSFGIGGTRVAHFYSDANEFAIANAAGASGFITMQTNGAEKMRLDASGNLGLGVTPSANAGVSTLNIANYNRTFSALTLGSNANNAGYVGYNMGNTSTPATWKYISADTGSALYFSGNEFRFMQFASGSAGATTSGTQAMTLDASSRLLVGLTSANASAGGAKFQVSQANDNWISYIENTNASGNIYCQFLRFSNQAPNDATSLFTYMGDNAGQRMAVRSNGGIANYSANNVNLSDRREKTNFAPAKSYLDVICAIPVQTFNYIDQNLEEDAGLTLGVVAQDVQAVAPELVTETNWANKDEEPKMRLSIYQTDLQYALMKCIQEQNQLITQLTARITALESA